MMSPWVLDELNRAHQEELRRAGRPFAAPTLLPALRQLVTSRRHRPYPSAPAPSRIGRLLHASTHPWAGPPTRRAGGRPVLRRRAV